MHSLLGLAGILALVALAFGEGAAVILARAIIFAVLLVLTALVIDIMTHGMLSDLI